MRSERVLVSMKSYIGDAVMTEPMIAALETAFVNLDFDAGSPVEQVLWHPDKRRNFVPTGRTRRLSEIIGHARAIRSRSYDVAILVNRSLRSALTVRLAGIKTRIGHDTEGRGPLLTRKVSYSATRFEPECQLDLARLAGIEAIRRVPSVPYGREESVFGSNLVKGATVGVQPGARWKGKQLPLETTVALISSLVSAGVRVVLLGGREEREAADAVGGHVLSLVGELSLRETIGVLSTLRCMVGADTGLMHLAAGVGCPTVTVFGPTCADKWGHDYAPHTVVRATNGDMSCVTPFDLFESVHLTLRHAELV